MTAFQRIGKCLKSLTPEIPAWGLVVIISFLTYILGVVTGMKLSHAPIGTAKLVSTSRAQADKSSVTPSAETKQQPLLTNEQKVKKQAQSKQVPSATDDPKKMREYAKLAANQPKEMREYAKLAANQALWVSDFHNFEVLCEVDKVFPGKYLFAAISPVIANALMEVFSENFGKPDGERVYKMQTTDALNRPSESTYEGRDYIYRDRLVNPTTGQKETLVVEFVSGFYRRARAEPSGNTSK